VGAQNFVTQKLTMAEDFSGALVMICGIASPSLGCNCEHHPICGSQVHLDMLLRIKSIVVKAGKSKNGRGSPIFIIKISPSSIYQITTNIGPF
jgi:hypothetical protein